MEPEDERQRLFYDVYYRDYAKVPTIQEQEQAMRAFNAATREIAHREEVDLVDVERVLPKSTDFMFDDVHYTVLGAETVARTIAESVQWHELMQEQ